MQDNTEKQSDSLNQKVSPSLSEGELRKNIASLCANAMRGCRYDCDTCTELDGIISKCQRHYSSERTKLLEQIAELKMMGINKEAERQALLSANQDHQKQVEELQARIKELNLRNKSLQADLESLNDEYAAQHIVTSRRIQSEAKSEERKKVGEWLDVLFKKGVSSFKYTCLDEGSYYLTFPYDDFKAFQSKLLSGNPVKE